MATGKSEPDQQPPGRRFRVALSFPGEYREYVQKVDAFLTAALGEKAVFYDSRYQAELARINLDIHLQNIYAEDSDLLVIFLCSEYEKKDWCRLEWRAIRDIIKRRREDDVMPFRFDDAHVPGVFSIDGYADARPSPTGEPRISSENAARLIRDRLNLNAQKLSPSGGDSAVVGPVSLVIPSPAAVAGAAIWNMPHQQNPNFTGRQDLLDALDVALCDGKPAALTDVSAGPAPAVAGRPPIGTPRALTGLGGVGKTQTAIEYAYRHRKDYAIIWWIRAEDPLTLGADYASLVAPLGLKAPKNTPQDDLYRAAKLALEARKDWLLIFDSAPNSDAIRSYLPSSAGHVLITSRDPNWRRDAQPLEVPEWPRDESVAFLQLRSGQTDVPGADLLSKTLGDFPLALEQAGAYVEATGVSFGRYVELFREHHQKLLGFGRPYGNRHDTVLTTWVLSMQEAAQSCPAAADLLNLLAYMAPDAAPLDLLRSHAGKLPEPLATVLADPLTTADAIAALRKFSLIQPAQDSVSVHRLVQAVTRGRLSNDQHKKWAAAAVSVVNAAFPDEGDDIRTWAVCGRLLAHAQVAAEHAELLTVAPAATARLLSEVGLHLMGRAQFAGARSVIERAMGIVEATCGPDHPDTAAIARNLGRVLQPLGDLKGSRAALERALRIDETNRGPNHPVVARDLNNLGHLLHASGELQKAKAAFERGLRILEAVSGEDQEAIATAVNNLGTILKRLGDLKGARAAFERALQIGEAAFGPDHPHVASYVNNLGSALRSSGNLNQTRAAYERALRIGEASLGPDHPEVAIWISNLGSVLQDLGDVKGAKACAERALRIDEAAYGPEHPETARDFNNLSCVLQKMGDLKGAKAYIERALRIWKATHGLFHLNTAEALKNLGVISHDMGDRRAAKEYLGQALRVFRTVLGDLHPDTKKARDLLRSIRSKG